MERIIIGIIILLTGVTLSVQAQTDTIKRRNARESTNPLPANRGQDHSKVLLDTSFAPGTKKGDSLMYKDKTKPGKQDKQNKTVEKNIPPAVLRKNQQLKDTTYRAK